MAEAEPGAGTIPITLDGREHELVPSLGACIAISNIAGGLNAAVQRCHSLDFGTICEVISAGLDLNPAQAKSIQKAVFVTGLFALAGSCIDFINIVGNGGRPLPEDGEEGEGEAVGDPPLPASR